MYMEMCQVLPLYILSFRTRTLLRMILSYIGEGTHVLELKLR